MANGSTNGGGATGVATTGVSGRRPAGAAERAAGATTQTVEVSAKTVDEAVLRALQQLGCGRDEVEVEVLHAGSPGRLLGFGAEPARIRVSRVVVVDVVDVPAPADVEDAARPVAGAFPPADVEDDEEEAVPSGAAPSATPRDVVRDAELARIMLAELLLRMGMGDLRAEVVSADPLILNILGGDVADLIGRRGENLRALQFVLSLMLNKQLRRHIRVIVDADGYRSRREELLTGMAQRFATRVRATGQPMQLEAMPPNERRIVHMALSDDPDLVTESVGEGDARRVVIKPRR